MTPHRFELSCAMEVEDVPEVRRFVERIYRRIIKNRDDLARVSMTMHELFENAVKFSTDHNARLEIDVSDDSVQIKTHNRARTSDIDGLRTITKELEASSDKMMFYVQRMQRAPDLRGGLGLGRVAAEGEMQLALDVTGDVVEVRASSPLTVQR